MWPLCLKDQTGRCILDHLQTHMRMQFCKSSLEISRAIRTCVSRATRSCVSRAAQEVVSPGQQWVVSPGLHKELCSILICCRRVKLMAYLHQIQLCCSHVAGQIFSMKTHTYIHQISCKKNNKYMQGIDEYGDNGFLFDFVLDSFRETTLLL